MGKILRNSKEHGENSGSIRNFYEEYHALHQSHFLGRVMQRKRIKTLRRLLNYLNPNVGEKKSKILIIGCGSGEDIAITDSKVYALDLSLVAILKSRKLDDTNHYICGDATHLPFVTEEFDFVICSEVIEHIPDAKTAVLEFHRILKPDGKLILTTPNWTSFYGLARKLGEAITHRSFSAGGQPVDNWYTCRSLIQLLLPQFHVIRKRGVWYFPPTGRGMRVIPAFITYPIYVVFTPLETLLSRTFPCFGHVIAVLGQKAEI